MSEETPKQCPNQNLAANHVRTQLDRQKEKLVKKGITPLFAYELYVFNCDKHENPSHHVDLVTSGLDKIQPGDLPHIISATERLLAMLKQRTA